MLGFVWSDAQQTPPPEATHRLDYEEARLPSAAVDHAGAINERLTKGC